MFSLIKIKAPPRLMRRGWGGVLRLENPSVCENPSRLHLKMEGNSCERYLTK